MFTELSNSGRGPIVSLQSECELNFALLAAC